MSVIVPPSKVHSHILLTRLKGLLLIMEITGKDLKDGSDIRVRLHSAKTLGNSPLSRMSPIGLDLELLSPPLKIPRRSPSNGPRGNRVSGHF